MSKGPQNYELAYILSSSVPEEETLTFANKLATFIAESKGLVNRTDAPKKLALAYHVKKERNGYFGLAIFNIAPEFLQDLEKKIKGEEKILRYLIVEEIKPAPPMIYPAARPYVSPKVRPKPAISQPLVPAAPEEKLDLEALDKKLEEILGK